MNRDGLEQIVVQLEVMQVDELAAIAPSDILRPFQFLGVGSRCCGSVSAHEDCFVFGCRCHC